MLVKDIFEEDKNDIYFLEIVGDKVVINDNYKGILIFDDRFNLVKKIDIFEEIIVDFTIKGKNGILFFCCNKEILLYLVRETLQYSIIYLKDFCDGIFSPLYIWENDFVLLSDYKGNMAKIDLKKEKLSLVEAKAIEVKRFENLYMDLRKLHVLKNDEIKKIAFVKKENDLIELVNYEDEIQTIYKLREGKFHDFEYEGNYISAIGEDETCVIDIKSGKIQKCYSENGWYMMRGKFMIKKDKIFFFLLEGNKADELSVKIIKYIVN